MFFADPAGFPRPVVHNQRRRFADLLLFLSPRFSLGRAPPSASFCGALFFFAYVALNMPNIFAEETVPILDNPRHEAFARGLAEGMSLVDAYERAGFKRHDGNSARLSGDERIRGRVLELQREAAKSTAVTVESITRELDDAMEFAKSCAAPAALVTAIMGKAKLNGLLIDKLEHSGSVDIADRLQAARRRRKLANTSTDMSGENDGDN